MTPTTPSPVPGSLLPGRAAAAHAGPIRPAGRSLAPADCPHCSEANGSSAKYCESCGMALPTAVRCRLSIIDDDAVPRTRAGHQLQTAKHYGTARKAAWALLAVAVLQVITATLFYFVLYRPAVAGTGEFDPQAALLVVASTGGLGAIFFGLFAWALRNPLPPAIVGLVLYVTALLLDAVADPRTLLQGWLVKIIVIAVLAKAVQAGVRHRRLAKSREAGPPPTDPSGEGSDDVPDAALA